MLELRTDAYQLNWAYFQAEFLFVCILVNQIRLAEHAGIISI